MASTTVKKAKAEKTFDELLDELQHRSVRKNSVQTLLGCWVNWEIPLLSNR